LQDGMEKRWVELWHRLGAVGEAEFYYELLAGRYKEAGRAYHTLEHIEHCLNEFDEVRNLANDPNAVELALWYHDVIYDTKRQDNEELSADLMDVADVGESETAATLRSLGPRSDHGD